MEVLTNEKEILLFCCGRCAADPDDALGYGLWFHGLLNTRFGVRPVEAQRPPQSWCYVEELAEG